MQQKINLSLSPLHASDHNIVIETISQLTGKQQKEITGFHILKCSLDARSKQVKINLTVLAFINEPFAVRELQQFNFKNIANARHSVVVIGAGPAGLFASLKLIENGIRPIILERGKDVKERRRDLAALNKQGIVNPESNYCFGEGGAGTYSDGKLYTRSNKRGDINRILNLFARFGAEENILYEAHPHIGTNKLPQIITAIRQQLVDCGATFLFNEKVVDLSIANDNIQNIITASNKSFSADATVLATGHSARDIFQLLNHKKIAIEAKPFALGVRVEHPQELINNIQYHSISNNNLPPASYSLVEQVHDKGVFSFCMCPGGIIAPAATNANEIVVNGWSPSKRNNPFANSGIVVTVEEKDAHDFFKERNLQPQNDPLLFMRLQQHVEQQAYIAGGGNLVAPAQRMIDFCSSKISETLPPCSYLPGVHATNLQQVLPDFIYKRLQDAFKAFGKKMKGYYTNEAIVIATESRTSSPVRIPRDAQTLQHIQIKNLYPCGEGAGYAGGIISAAMDGENVAAKIIAKLV